MAEIIKIVLTGGPCGGKSSALSYLKQELTVRGVSVACVEESASIVKRYVRAKILPDNMSSFAFHHMLFAFQLKAENEALLQLAESKTEKAVLLCDRGLMDSKAYVTPEDFTKYSSVYGFSENSILCRYDAVFHLVTAADGAEEYYTTGNNEERDETPEQARELDKRTMAVWAGTPHLRVIDNSTDFPGKLGRLLDEVLAALGIPEPLEIERKFLILYPDLEKLNRLPVCRRVPMSQTYLETPAEGRFRVRKRGEDADAVYIKTTKQKISDLKRIEREAFITEEQYGQYISNKEYCHGTISKDRYCFVWKNQYFELDVFPFWDKFALLELELLDENQSYVLPDFVYVIREVTTDKQYRNKTLAKTYEAYFNNNTVNHEE